MSKLVRVAHCQSESVLTCHPPDPQWGLTVWWRRKQSERGTRRRNCIGGGHMALTAYEMYNYYLQLVKHMVVAETSGQSFLFICSCVHLGSCRPRFTPVLLQKSWRGLLSAAPQHLPKISLFSYRRLFVSHWGMSPTQSYLTITT